MVVLLVLGIGWISSSNQLLAHVEANDALLEQLSSVSVYEAPADDDGKSSLKFDDEDEEADEETDSVLSPESERPSDGG